MILLGIETSCDETSVGIVKDGSELLACVTASSMDIHAQYGGVVPEIAAREHIQAMTPTLNSALKQAGQDWSDIDAIAVTYGAGLGGSLLIGVLTARTLAITKRKPLYAINHVEGHVYANFLTSAGSPSELREQSLTSPDGSFANVQKWNLGDQPYELPAHQPAFPCLALIVSGGHSQLALFHDHFDYTLLGQTQDDAIGEAFDKVAKILGLPYPGGPSIAKAAQNGNPDAFTFPKAQLKTVSSGLQVLRLAAKTTSSVYSDGVQGSNENHANRTDGTESKTRKQLTQQSAESSNVGGFAGKSAAVNTSSYDFSFSGLKTAVLRAAQNQAGVDHTFPSYKLSEQLSEADKANLAASFQHTAIETVVDKTLLAFEEFRPQSVVIAGGVAASQELRRQLSARLPIEIMYTDIKLCTDNGAMIAALGCFKAMHNQPTADPYSLDIAPNLSM